MIIVMDPNASAEAIERVSQEIVKMGGQPHLSRGKFRTVIGAVGDEMALDQSHLKFGRGGKSRSDHEAVQAGQPGVP